MVTSLEHNKKERVFWHKFYGAKFSRGSISLTFRNTVIQVCFFLDLAPFKSSDLDYNAFKSSGNRPRLSTFVFFYE